jgi:hypothetical protein
VEVIAFLPHTARFFQPMDVSWAKSFKAMFTSKDGKAPSRAISPPTALVPPQGRPSPQPRQFGLSFKPVQFYHNSMAKENASVIAV